MLGEGGRKRRGAVAHACVPAEGRCGVHGLTRTTLPHPLQGGKPIGFKLCIGRPEEFAGLVRAMLSTGIVPDFVTIDGAEGGTGAAPAEFSDSVGMPMADGLVLAHSLLVGAGVRDRIKVIAAGKVRACMGRVGWRVGVRARRGRR